MWIIIHKIIRGLYRDVHIQRKNTIVYKMHTYINQIIKKINLTQKQLNFHMLSPEWFHIHGNNEREKNDKTACRNQSNVSPFISTRRPPHTHTPVWAFPSFYSRNKTADRKVASVHVGCILRHATRLLGVQRGGKKTFLFLWAFVGVVWYQRGHECAAVLLVCGKMGDAIYVIGDTFAHTHCALLQTCTGWQAKRKNDQAYAFLFRHIYSLFYLFIYLSI